MIEYSVNGVSRDIGQDISWSTIRPNFGGSQFLHGVSLAAHDGHLWCSFAVNDGLENSGSEYAAARRSADGGLTWSADLLIGSPAEGIGTSHGALAAVDGELRALCGTVSEGLQDIGMIQFRYESVSGTFIRMPGTVPGFWPMQEPVRMSDGRWAIAGLWKPEGCSAAEVRPAVVQSIDRSLSNFLAPNVIDVHEDPPFWGEAALIPGGGGQLTLVSRFDASHPVLLQAHSHDEGSTWGPAVASNVPFSASKPAAGRLRTGEAYVIGTSFEGVANQRSPLVILVGEPHSLDFADAYVIAHTPGHLLSYPAALETEESLLVAFSDDEGRGGHNLNRLVLARIPLATFAKSEVRRSRLDVS